MTHSRSPSLRLKGEGPIPGPVCVRVCQKAFCLFSCLSGVFVVTLACTSFLMADFPRFSFASRSFLMDNSLPLTFLACGGNDSFVSCKWLNGIGAIIF